MLLCRRAAHHWRDCVRRSMTALLVRTRCTYDMQNNLSAGMIVAGWDARDGGSVYALPLGGTLVKVPFSIGAHKHDAYIRDSGRLISDESRSSVARS